MGRLYYLRVDGVERRVSKRDWIMEERRAGFRPECVASNPEYMEVCVTEGFSYVRDGVLVEGYIVN